MFDGEKGFINIYLFIYLFIFIYRQLTYDANGKRNVIIKKIWKE